MEDLDIEFSQKRRQQQEMREWTDALVQEKQRIRAYQADIDRAYTNDLLEATKAAKEVEREVALKRAQRAREAQAENKVVGEQRRANRGSHLSSELPPRMSDDDPRCGPSSIQKFDGEDLGAAQRKKRQAEQMKRWQAQMVDEKDERKWAEKEAEMQHVSRMEQANLQAHQAQAHINQMRKNRDVEFALHNKALSEQQKDEKSRDKFRETQANLQEIQYQLDSDLLQEHPEACHSAVEPNRFRTDHMKGFDPSTRQQILNEQAAQREEKVMIKKSEKEEEKQWAVWMEQERRKGILLDRQREREKRTGRQGLADDQKLQHQDKLARVPL